MQSEILLNHISMTYQQEGKNSITALEDISMGIEKGTFVSLLGPSGCGKSTLLGIMADLLQPSSGEISIAGESPRTARLNKKYGIVFQNAVLYDWRTVEQNIGLPLEVMKVKDKNNKKEWLDRIEEMLELVNLKDFAKYYPHQLSGGMQQRVSIARALAINPEILLMDEPFSALDEFSKERLQDDLLRIWTKTSKTIIFVTHSIAEAVYLSDQVYVMSPHPGRLSAVVDIDLPRQRTQDMRESKQFYSLVSKIRHSFELEEA
ncbi:ABC transporter ATP-binding protein [uncultured Sphaerochaeta sp.]|uniref:ABC transporter ATP-binding protein n=1 Tax=uncultured Sphaerochaeta sp. TaxID=886478 RepID=UPI002A0A37F3|nr:ABC transporter ATP-binding protein [uncultured Sphaerochaeta sp.]